ncbi:uncharacterized protein K460DRAFT_355415 [Cucurbitaria berberidis CBS 394.84]|uniref:F-box domain-containing protein n=1 Tax=Cucurbitaria berberidis CBS 394.84 TaxID=1168544 RepID=A0A9P4L8T5_9PLEO|nr:uncharacterized protein K460DRAFT_355415 [Cucurbitaria berberidis CBS 394.84]KAF1845618.1 hypothetical protein K460DRAFT_355415 [Cucurbitaria berberidis CBS 394.84]
MSQSKELRKRAKREHDYEPQFPVNKDSNGTHERRSSTFLKLPRELRDMVYHHLWKATPVLKAKCRQISYYALEFPNATQETAKIFRFTVSYDGGDEYDQHRLTRENLPQWLCANKAILEEGLEQLRAHGTWRMSFSSNNTPINISFRGLLTPALAYNLRITILNRGGYEMFKGTELLGTPKSIDQRFSLMKQIEGNAPGPQNGHQVRKLDLTVPQAAFGNSTQGELFHVYMSGITRSLLDLPPTALPSLQEMTLGVRVFGSDSHTFMHRVESGVFTRMGENLRQLASTVLGDDASEHFLSFPEDCAQSHLRVCFKRK